MRITLVTPSPIALDPHQSISVPLGIAYLGAVLEREGHDVTLIDGVVCGKPEPLDKGRWRLGASVQALSSLVEFSRPDLIGISCPFTTRYGEFNRLSEAIRSKLPNVPILAGGIHPTLFPIQILERGDCDLIVLGEGESTLLELVRRFAVSGKIEPEGLDGVAWREAGRVQINRKSKYIEELDTLPDPARHLLPMQKYLERSGGRWSSRWKTCLSVITSRSCPGRCSFCSIHAVFGPTWRARSPERVIDEVESLNRAYRPSLIAFEDDRLTWDRDRLLKICRGLRAMPRPVHWFTPNGVHVADLDEELLRAMKDSGCVSLNLAIESGDPEILHRVIGKKANPSEAREVAETCRKIGIQTNAYFVLGMPGETDQSLERTLELCLSLPLDGIGLFIATPFPGTRMFDECVSAGLIEPDKLLDFYSDAADAELLHKPMYETSTMSKERLLWWRDRIKREFMRGLYRRKPELILRAAARKVVRGIFSR